MQIVGFEKFKLYFKNNSLPRLCILYGEDEYMLKQCKALYMGQRKILSEQFNLMTVDCRVKPNIDTAVEFLSTVPFMSDIKLLILENLSLSSENIDSSGFELLLGELNKAQESSVCLITLLSEEVSSKGTAATRAKKLISLADSVGTVVNTPVLQQQEFISLLSEVAEKRGCKLTKRASILLFEEFLERTSEAVQEVEKLCSYCQGADIDEAAVQLLVEKTPEARVFSVCDMLLQRQLGKAQKELGNLFFHRQTPESISQIISMTMSDIYLAALAQSANKTQNVAAEDFAYYGGKSYRLKKQWKLAEAIGVKRLLKAVQHSVNVDVQMKSVGTNSAVLLEAELVELYDILWL